jgi:hypothetical protein
MKNKGMQLGAVLAAMLILSMAFVPAVSAQAVQKEEVNVATSGCQQGINDDPNVKVETKELTGDEKNKAIAQALSDKSVTGLRQKLVVMGFKPSIANISVIEGKTTNESGTITTLIVGMPFDSKNKNESAIITYASNELGNAAAAGILSNGMRTILGYDSLSGEVQIQGVVCDFCMWAFTGVCAFITNQGCSSGCTALCLRVPNPLWVVTCYVSCRLLCSFVISYGACNWGADAACKGAGLC